MGSRRLGKDKLCLRKADPKLQINFYLDGYSRRNSMMKKIV